MLAVLAVGIAVPVVLNAIEYRRFKNSKDATLNRMIWDNTSRDLAIASAFSDLTFSNRFNSVIGFAGIWHQRTGSTVLLVDWFSLRSDADAVLVTLEDGRSINCPLSKIFGPTEPTHFDSDVYYHHQVNLTAIGLGDGGEIKYVELIRGDAVISDAIRPQEWSPQRPAG